MAAVAAAGAAVASFRTVREAAAERKAAEARQREDFAERRDEDSGRYTRDLLRHATEFLIDALWTRERTLCDALDAARNAARDGLAVGEEPSATLLGELDLAVRAGSSFRGTFHRLGGASRARAYCAEGGQRRLQHPLWQHAGDPTRRHL